MAYDKLRALLNEVPADLRKKGDVIFTEGEESNGIMYFILSGAVVVTRVLGSPPKEKLVRIMGPGEFVGELALIGDPHRKANVKVATDTARLAIINHKVFQHLGNVSPPFLSLLLKKAIFRLTETEKILTEKKIEHQTLTQKLHEKSMGELINGPSSQKKPDLHEKAMEEVARLSQEPVDDNKALNILSNELAQNEATDSTED